MSIRPMRLAGRKLYVPGYGVLPYVRGLQLVERRNLFYFRVRLKNGDMPHFRVRNGDYLSALEGALERLEKDYGTIQTVRNFNTVESARKKTPTGYVGVFVYASVYKPWKTTCPVDMHTTTFSLFEAVELRRQAEAEYLRKNSTTASKLLSRSVKPVEEMA